VGSIVRVPLSGRKTRGFVVELDEEHEGKLKDIAALSSQVPVFDVALLKTITWAAGHYVAPLSVLLDRSAPPNLPSPPGDTSPSSQARHNGGQHPLLGITREIASGRRRPTTAMVGRWQAMDWLDAVLPVLDIGSSVLVVTATGTEANTVGGEARKRGIDTVMVAGEVARELTGAWVEAQTPGRLVVGTPRAAMWQIADLGLAIVLEEGRRAMKDRQTPTVHVREVVTTRSRIEGFSLVFIGPTPTVEVLASGPEIVRAGARAWPLVEVVDRREDPPGSGLLAERTVAAIRATVADHRGCFVFTHRRASDASMRCVSCRRVRACPECGSRMGRQPACPRCGRAAGACAGCGGTGFEEMGSEPERIATEINRKLGGDVAGVHPTERPVAVGTERDLPSARAVPLAVAVDVDGLMLGHNYRTAEEALRILARLANLVESGHGRRMMAQTSLPDSSLLTALRRGDPVPYLEGLLGERARLGLPPATDMLAVEIRGVDDPGRFDQDLRGLEHATVLGPASVAAGWRWLLQGKLGPYKPRLRSLVQAWRESGATVRIDADPIDL